MAKITVDKTDISIIQKDKEDYICLTDMLKAKDGDFFVTDWLCGATVSVIKIFWCRYIPTTAIYGVSEKSRDF